MTLSQFRLLLPRAQLLHVLTAGTYLAQRWKSARGVNLYYLTNEARGFFAEVGYCDTTFETLVLRSFSRGVLLEVYAQQVRLPAL